MPPPVFLLAFAYNPTDALPEVVNELGIIQRLLTETGGNAEPIWKVTHEDLERAFDVQRDDLRLFHYSGHAGPTGLQLNDNKQVTRISFAGGLARLAGLAPGLRLVFLNGCSTDDQAAAFLKMGIPAVIATTKPLVDRYAVEFARSFYDNFTRRGSHNTLQQAFDTAFDSFMETHGDSDPALYDAQIRGIFNLKEDPGQPLYELHINQDKKAVANQRFAEWFDAPPESIQPVDSPAPATKDVSKIKGSAQSHAKSKGTEKIDISGNWSNGTGNRFVFGQANNLITFERFDNFGNRIEVGNGTITGNKVQIASIMDNGRGDVLLKLEIAEDGNKLFGTAEVFGNLSDVLFERIESTKLRSEKTNDDKHMAAPEADISGSWGDGSGSQYVFRQNDNLINYEGYSSRGNKVEDGTGFIAGNNVQITAISFDGGNAFFKLQVTDGGIKLLGTAEDSRGIFNLLLERLPV